MAENNLLVAIQKRKKINPSVSAKGISLASWHVSAFLRQLQEAAGSKSKLTQYQKAHHLNYDWPAIIKAAENKLIFQDDNAAITKGIYSSGEKFGEYADEITPKSALDFDCILTTKSRDRDGDVLEPTGANLDRKMPLLLHHLPTEPIGRFVKLLSQDDSGVVIRNAIVGTPLGHDTAIMVEFKCFRISHGFEPKEYEPLSLASSAYKDSALGAVLADDGDAGWHVKVYDVMEVSLVTIPSNPDADILETMQSRGKWHHPVTKLLASKKLEDRPAIVTSGFEGEKNHVINVTINNGPDLATKSAKSRKRVTEIGNGYAVCSGDEIGENSDEWYIVRHPSGNHVDGPYSSEEEAIQDAARMGLTKTKKGRKEEDMEEEELEEKEIETPEEVAEEESEELAVEEKQEEMALGGGLLDDIDADIKAFGKSKQLPQEAKDRVQMIRNMIAGMKQKLAGHGDAIAKALKQQDVAGVGDIHREMCSTLTNGLKRICREMDQLATVEELSDEQRQQLTEMQSGATAAHDMFKSYHSGLKDSAVDGDATETEEEEIEGMETKDSGMAYQEGWDAYTGDDTAIFTNPYEQGTPEFNAWADGFSAALTGDDAFGGQPMVASHSPTTPKAGVVIEDGLYWIELDDGGREGPFNTQQEAEAAWDIAPIAENVEEEDYEWALMASHAVASKAVSVEEQDGQFIVVDESGQVVGGPYATQQEADAMFYELQSQEEGWLSSHAVGSQKDESFGDIPMSVDMFPVQQNPKDGLWYYFDAGDYIGQGYASEEEAQAALYSITRSADDVALKLIGLIADGKSHELRSDVATMLRKSLKSIFLGFDVANSQWNVWDDDNNDAPVSTHATEIEARRAALQLARETGKPFQENRLDGSADSWAEEM